MRPWTGKPKPRGSRRSPSVKSLLLSLTENKTLAAGEARSILQDAAATHRNAISLSEEGARHEAAAAVIELILAGGNSVRFD